MNSFAFLPRSFRARETRPASSSKSIAGVLEDQAEHDYPKDIILKVTLAAHQIEGDGKVLDNTTLTSHLEHLIPRSCNYVHVSAASKRKFYVRAAAPDKARQIKEATSKDVKGSELRFEGVSILEGEEERQYWGKIPLRVQNRVKREISSQSKLKGRRNTKKRRSGRLKSRDVHTNTASLNVIGA